MSFNKECSKKNIHIPKQGSKRTDFSKTLFII